MNKTLLCACGERMHRHGYRSFPALGYEVGFGQTMIDVTRYRCPRCGVSTSVEDPETEAGFRLSIAAADALEALALEQGMTKAAEAAGVDKSTVSRLIAARADASLDAHKRPDYTSLVQTRPGIVAAYDAVNGKARAFFAPDDDERMLDWLSRPNASVVLPDASLAAKCLHWGSRVTVALGMTPFLEMLAPILKQCARRCAKIVVSKPSDQATLGKLLAAEPTELSIEEAMMLAEIGKPGTQVRFYLRLRDRLKRLFVNDDLPESQRRLAAWSSDCQGSWKEIFLPAVQFLQTYGPLILQHPIAVFSQAERLSVTMEGPANLMTLAAVRGRFHKPFQPNLEPFNLGLNLLT